MAAAYGALVSLMNTIEQIKDRPLLFTSLQKKWVESARQRVEFLLDFIEKYSSHGGIDGLEMRIAFAAYDAEAVIESHIADQIRADERRSSIFLADLQKIIDQMDCIKEEITIKVKEETRSEDEQQAACSIPAAATSWRAHQTKMVGFDEELRQLMDVLTREESSRQIISVLGMGGTGKSTLVRNVFANSITVRRFDVCAGASVTQKYSVRGILIDLLVSFKQKPTSETAQELGEMLYKFLFGRRYLIVLDDVWSVDVWDEIRSYFPDNNNKSRIILTTRVSNVANHCNSYCFSMYLLDEDRSWILFSETVFGREDCPRELEEVGKEISKVCRGLPLSIVVVGGFLQTLYIRSDDRQLYLRILVVAPLEIWNLHQLRHVVCTRIYIPDPPPNIVLENLQTLTTVVNLRLSEEVCKRIPNVNKLYVEYDSDAPGFAHCWPDHLHNFGSLHKLRSLKLVNSDFNRSSIRAGWRKCTFPTSLKKLKLQNCRIDWDDLTRISSLPHLEVLKLHNSAKGQNWSPAEGEFRALKVLSINFCDLRCWNADSSHFPVLKELFLERMSRLKEIPLDIGEIPTLELIHVYECNKSAHISAEKIKKEQEELGNERLQIQISTPISHIRTFSYEYSNFLFDYGKRIMGGFFFISIFLCILDRFVKARSFFIYYILLWSILPPAITFSNLLVMYFLDGF